MYRLTCINHTYCSNRENTEFWTSASEDIPDMERGTEKRRAEGMTKKLGMIRRLRGLTGRILRRKTCNENKRMEMGNELGRDALHADREMAAS